MRQTTTSRLVADRGEIDNARRTGSRTMFNRCGAFCAAIAVVVCGVHGLSAAIVITGDPTTTTGISWTWQGHSLGTTGSGNPNGVIWADGANGTTPNGFGYDVYTASWYLTGNETVTSGVEGNTQASLSAGAFQAGDRVVAIGWKLDPGLVAWNNSFFKFDPDAIPGTYTPATEANFLLGNATNVSFGANSNKGDFQVSGSPQVPNEFRMVDFRVRDSATGSYYPFQGNVASGAFTVNADDLPVRTFTVPYSGTDPNGVAQVMLLNTTKLAEVSFTDTHSATVNLNAIGNSLLFYMQLGGVFSGGTYPSNPPSAGATGVVILADVTPVPEPGTLVMAAMGGLALCLTAWRRYRAIA